MELPTEALLSEDLDVVATVHGSQLVLTIANLDAVAWTPYEVIVALTGCAGGGACARRVALLCKCFNERWAIVRMLTADPSRSVLEYRWEYHWN